MIRYIDSDKGADIGRTMYTLPYVLGSTFYLQTNCHQTIDINMKITELITYIKTNKKCITVWTNSLFVCIGLRFFETMGKWCIIELRMKKGQIN